MSQDTYKHHYMNAIGFANGQAARPVHPRAIGTSQKAKQLTDWEL